MISEPVCLIDVGRLLLLILMINECLHMLNFNCFSSSCTMHDACNMQINIDSESIIRNIISHNFNLIGFENRVVNFPAAA